MKKLTILLLLTINCMVPVRQNPRDGWRGACEKLERLKFDNGIPWDSGDPTFDDLSEVNMRFILYGLKYELHCKQYFLNIPIEDPKK